MCMAPFGATSVFTRVNCTTALDAPARAGYQMPHRLMVQELADGQVAAALQRSGQSFSEPAGDSVAFDCPFGAGEREELRWHLEDCLIAPYAVYEDRGPVVEARLPDWARSHSSWRTYAIADHLYFIPSRSDVEKERADGGINWPDRLRATVPASPRMAESGHQCNGGQSGQLSAWSRSR
jgi:hypothetical protein